MTSIGSQSRTSIQRVLCLGLESPRYSTYNSPIQLTRRGPDPRDGYFFLAASALRGKVPFTRGILRGPPCSTSSGWLPVAMLYLFGGLCFFLAFWGAFWFDVERELMLSEAGGVHGWRLRLWELFCTWPANGIKGSLAIYAGWSIWWTNWKATRHAVVAVVLLLGLAAVANHLTIQRLLVF